jgi:hypothetical protein
VRPDIHDRIVVVVAVEAPFGALDRYLTGLGPGHPDQRVVDHGEWIPGPRQLDTDKGDGGEETDGK